MDQLDLSFLLKGVVIGFAIAAPVGPIGVLCIRTTLAEGRVAGLVTGLGAASADAIYGSIAAFGVTFVSEALIEQEEWFRLVGGLFLCYLGLRALLTAPVERAAVTRRGGLAAAYASTFLLTVVNPATILSFAAVFAGLGIASEGGHYLSAAALVLGVFAGSALWWLMLSGGVGALRSRFNPRGLRWVNHISGLIIAGFGVVALVSLMG
ncbi:MAG: LysE family transporter [Dehalococcoidia bacterium]